MRKATPAPANKPDIKDLEAQLEAAKQAEASEPLAEPEAQVEAALAAEKDPAIEKFCQRLDKLSEDALYAPNVRESVANLATAFAAHLRG